MRAWRSPICARCCGLLVGVPCGVLCALCGMFASRWYGAILWVPILLDGWTQEAGWRTSNNFLRVITGIVGGLGAGVFVVLWLQGDVNVVLSWLR